MEEVHFHRRNLPHLYIKGRTYFITSRLKDSLPISKISELRHEVNLNYVVETKEDKFKKDKLFFKYYDDLLDKGSSNSLFKNEEFAEIVKQSIFHLNNQDYLLLAFCIMPNHLHLLINQMEKGRQINEIMKSIKGYSAREINKQLNIKGALWQPENFDHIVRDDSELNRILKYIIYNPVKAKLVEKWKDWSYIFVNKEFFDIK